MMVCILFPSAAWNRKKSTFTLSHKIVGKIALRWHFCRRFAFIMQNNLYMLKFLCTFARSFACITKTRPIQDVKPDLREASLCTCWNYKRRLLRFVLGTSESGSSRVYSQGNATMNACCVWIYMSPLWAYYIYTRRDSCLLSYCNMLARAKMCGIVTSYPAFLCQS